MSRYRYSIGHTTKIKAKFGGRYYKVHDEHPKPGEAANILATLDKRIVALLRHMRDTYLHKTDNTYAWKLTLNLLARYNPDNLVENSPLDPSGDTAYSLDKGRVIAICLRDKKTLQFEDLEILTFVTIHEMTHVAVDAVDHPPEFWAAFKFLLIEAEKTGYISPDYRQLPDKYCGLLVDYNPRYDHTI